MDWNEDTRSDSESQEDTRPVKPVNPADPMATLQPIRLSPQPVDETRPYKPPAPPPPPARPVEPRWEPAYQEPIPPPPPPRRQTPPGFYSPYGPPPPPPPPQPKRRVGCLNCGCLTLVLPLIFVLVYFLAPLRTNFLLLGIDRTPEGTFAGRSDTNILVSVVPLKPTIAMLSIPRDLWVNLPGVGEQRINTAHYFAELEEPGSGPRATADAIESIFRVPVPYYARFSFSSLTGIVDAMGGVVINLAQDTAGLPAGEHRLNGEQALAFARSRAGADDFFRMEHGQLLIRAIVRQLMSPANWGSLPAVFQAGLQAVDTNIPFWLWPRLGLAVLRAGPDGIDSRTLNRDMVTPWLTPGGANVLLPNWDAIDPLVSEMFGRGTLLSAGASQ
ncbi:MAG TPA: LCP family protein [Anaerolineaceae bacterium]|nr:LCP family protein [Anaerolineaceae bacterium]